MQDDDVDHNRSVAVEQLEAFGLSSYAARTFAALVTLGDGTAKDVSAISEVPRTRVYDAAAELREHGLVDVRQSTPKRFAAVSAETAGRRFRREYVRRVDLLTDALDEIEPASYTSEQRGVWTVTGREPVTDRVLEFLDGATGEIIYMTVGSLLSEAVVDALRAASERGVRVRFGGMEPEVQEELRRDVAATETFDTLWDWSAVPAGRLLLVDRRKTLASVVVPDDDGAAPDRPEETAIWGSGETNSLVVVLKAMFTWQLDGERD